MPRLELSLHIKFSKWNGSLLCTFLKKVHVQVLQKILLPINVSIIKRMFIKHMKTRTVQQQYFESFLIRGWGFGGGGGEEGGGGVHEYKS